MPAWRALQLRLASPAAALPILSLRYNVEYAPLGRVPYAMPLAQRSNVLPVSSCLCKLTVTSRQCKQMDQRLQLEWRVSVASFFNQVGAALSRAARSCSQYAST